MKPPASIAASALGIKPQPSIFASMPAAYAPMAMKDAWPSVNSPVRPVTTNTDSTPTSVMPTLVSTVM